ncbi:GrpB family protein [Actinomadura terrae]|uniref:GrpB family protein n=1 Tax=Actinomadura terrae TaxID=604353 RepID=UPI001FA6CD8D|nr:GrpB family protein [Actinomadura terrae]
MGSTAVPGPAAKPVVDMLAPVRSLERAVDAVPVAGQYRDRNAYSNAESRFVEDVLRRPGLTAPSRLGLPE